MRPTQLLSWLLVGWLLLAGSVALAQGADDKAKSGKILSGSQLTEDNLIDALTPDEGVGRTRSLKVNPSSEPASAPAGARPSASLLITFRSNSSELSTHARQQLDVVGRALKSDQLADYVFLVEGHADPTGNSQANLVLSQARADSVREYLVKAHGIEESRLKSVGKGDTELMNRANPTAAENRRVTFVNESP